jgi:hypothetical protein
MNEFDPTTLSATAGVTGALTYVVVQVLKAVTGWQDRRALVAASFVALFLAAIAWGATHWQVVRDVWDVLLAWLGGLASATGLYKLNRGGQNEAVVRELREVERQR